MHALHARHKVVWKLCRISMRRSYKPLLAERNRMMAGKGRFGKQANANGDEENWRRVNVFNIRRYCNLSYYHAYGPHIERNVRTHTL